MLFFFFWLFFVASVCFVRVRPITGTFLDVQYDSRLKYANPAAFNFSCADWESKMRDWVAFGIDLVIFQAVHDQRWGAYYASEIHRVWGGRCTDVVGTVLRFGERSGSLKVFLSSEFVQTDSDNVTSPFLMQGRHAIMKELVAKNYTASPAFVGWYFASEAFLTPYFTTDFLTYISTMAQWAKAVTPLASVLISPYGTRFAVNDATFRAQLQRIPVDVVAYQDEVGCVRDFQPVEQSRAAFKTLAAAHAQAGRPEIWGNVESFTWEAAPNNATSALIPAPWPRIAAQLDAVTPTTARTITFTVEAIYESGGTDTPAWGPPSARRLADDYGDLFRKQSTRSKLLIEAVSGDRVSSIAVGRSVGLVDGSLDQRLADGEVGPQSPYSPRWIQGNDSSDLELALSFAAPLRVSGFGAHFLQVPGVWFTAGNVFRPNLRNLTSGIWLPARVDFFIQDSSNSTWQDCGRQTVDFWPQEVYDIRTHLAFLALPRPMLATSLVIVARNRRPQWAKAAPIDFGRAVGRLLVDELIVI